MTSFLNTFVHNPWLLLVGLLVLLIPPIIHLLNRRRFDVVEWGAMQFLQISETTRRRLMLEEILLMLLRIGLLGVLVFAIAGAFLAQTPTWLAKAQKLGGGQPPRDVVLVIDGSASMLAHAENEKPPIDLAKQFALDLIAELSPGDGVAILVAREQPVPLVETLSVDRVRARQRLDDLPPPAGTTNWPEAVRLADVLLADSQKGRREVILLTDNQRFGWADADTLFRWELVAGKPNAGDRSRPNLWAVDLSKGRPARLPNWSLRPIKSGRPVVTAEREVTFVSGLILHGQKDYTPPHQLRVEVEWQPRKEDRVKDETVKKVTRVLTPPGGTDKARPLPVPKDGVVPFAFAHVFPKPGSYLVSLIVEPDVPEAERHRDYQVKDRMAGDNRQDFAVEVLDAVPILIVDGEASVGTSPHRRSDFLRDALSPARDPRPVVKATVVSVKDFTAATLTADPRPRVVVLHDVGRLEQPQTAAIEAFLAEGGGVLVALGGRAEPEWYNQNLFRGGEGWFPARLDTLDGDENKPREVMRPDLETFSHPALVLFNPRPPEKGETRTAVKFDFGGLNEAKFYRWWKLTVPGKSTTSSIAGTMNNVRTGKDGKKEAGSVGTPFFVGRDVAAGRVLACAVPLDNSWGTNLIDLPSFVPLAHEVTYYLAGARTADFNVKAGQPLRYRAKVDARLDTFRLRPPLGEEKPLSGVSGIRDSYLAQLVPAAREAVVLYEGARQAGVYRLTTPEEQVVYYVVPTDEGEADLTPAVEEEREKVAKLTGLKYATDKSEVKRDPEREPTELWWYLLVGLLALLCLEVWMTRRAALGR